MAERPRELDERFQVGGQFEAIIDWGVTFRAIATWRNLRLRVICVRYNMVYSGLYECNEYNAL